MKIRPVAGELFHTGGRTDGHTDMTELIVAFRNFADAPKIRERRRYVYTTLLLPDTCCSRNYGASKNSYILQIARLIKIKIIFGFLHRMVELRPKHVEGSS